MRLHLLGILSFILIAAPFGYAQQNQYDFRTLDSVVQDAIANKQAPGAVVLVGHNGHVVYRKAFGKRSLEPTQEPMTVDTVFDIASLSKCVATATAMMVLYEQGRFRLNDPVSMYMPEFRGDGKEQITIRQLLTHYSGLRPDLDLNPYWEGKEEALRRIWAEKPANPPGSQFVYSDINFETLGFLVEKLSGLPLEVFAQRNIFQPLRMTQTSYRPLVPPVGFDYAVKDVQRIAPTEYDPRNGQMLRGIVHDPTARRMGGVAGHAGVFSTADDLALYAQAMLDTLNGTPHLFSKVTAEKMTTPQSPPNETDLRGLGWDIDTPFSSDRGELLPVGSFGHTGFTGTSLHIDPYTQTYVIILSNAVHPRVSAPVTNLRARVANAVAQALGQQLTAAQKQDQFRITGYNEANASVHRPVSRTGQVLTGIDVLEARGFAGLTGKRIGLLTNQTGNDSKGQRTIDVLAHAPGVKLTTLFSTEHGVTGALDQEHIDNSKDLATGLPVVSVYGETDAKKRPPLDVLRQLDAVVIDLQDAGVRYYTYETTVGYFLEAAAKTGTEIIVLDRPDPVSLPYVQGPVADSDKLNYVAYHTTPVRHGMTMGELARMFNSERNLNAKLTVVPMQGYLPGDWFDSTGLEWTNPSPNLRNLIEATLYTGVALIEYTNVSVGRGTDTPFEVVGAPWMLGRERNLAAYLNSRSISGVRFVPVTFTPSSGPFAKQQSGGVNIVLTDRYQLDGPEMGIEIASALRTLFGPQFQIEKMDALLVNKASLDALIAGTDPRIIAERWRDGIAQFEQRRKAFELYTNIK
ncbi:MAG TPA: serine hydrolase [Terriglobales bacterium]